jgi:hypothetical protein
MPDFKGERKRSTRPPIQVLTAGTALAVFRHLRLRDYLLDDQLLSTPHLYFLYLKYLSSDNDPLFQYHRWKANLRVLEIGEIKSLPHVPMSHPFVEKLIGSIRRELLDQTLFWTATDLENKLRDYHCYYNQSRTHTGRNGATPVSSEGKKVIDINNYQWDKHCRGLFELPVAA